MQPGEFHLEVVESSPEDNIFLQEGLFPRPKMFKQTLNRLSCLGRKMFKWHSWRSSPRPHYSCIVDFHLMYAVCLSPDVFFHSPNVVIGIGTATLALAHGDCASLLRLALQYSSQYLFLERPAPKPKSKL